MARKRMIDPSLWESETFGLLSLGARVLWIGIISNADDEGRLKASETYLRANIFRYDDHNSVSVHEWLTELSVNGMVRVYEVDGKQYAELPNWLDYQKINRPSPSKIPPFTEDSLKTHGGLTPNRIEVNRSEVKRSEEKGTFSLAPSHAAWFAAMYRQVTARTGQLHKSPDDAQEVNGLLEALVEDRGREKVEEVFRQVHDEQRQKHQVVATLRQAHFLVAKKLEDEPQRLDSAEAMAARLRARDDAA